MIAGAVGLYLVAAAFARREEEAALEEDIAELKKNSMKGQTMLEGLDWMTEQMVTGEYLTKDDVLQVRLGAGWHSFGRNRERRRRKKNRPGMKRMCRRT